MKKIFQYLISIVLASLLIWYISTIIDFRALWIQLKSANFFWIFISMLVSIIAHISRAYRWNLLLEAGGNKTSLLVSLEAVLVGYLANYAVPRLGEVSRSGIVSKKQNIPISTVIGTVIVERLMDVLMMGLLLGVCFLVEFDRLSSLIQNNLSGKISGIQSILDKLWLIVIILLIAFISAFYTIIKFKSTLRRNAILDKIFTIGEQLWSGFGSILTLKRKGTFLLHTCIIWFIYYLMTYTIFFSLDSTSGLPPMAGFVALALSALGMSAPVQGGIGAYHLMVAAALAIYGISQENGIVLATLLHTSQFVTICIVGGLSLLHLFVINKK